MTGRTLRGLMGVGMIAGTHLAMVVAIGGLALGSLPAWSQSMVESTWPARAGRLVEVQGSVRVYDPEQGQWIRAGHNLPLTSGDRLSTDPASRAEVRIGSTTIRLAEQTDVLLRRIDDQAIEVELMAGSLALRATARELLSQLSILTPEGRFQPSNTGHFRIDRLDQASHATAWRGSLDFQGRDSRMRIESGAHVELWLQDAPQRTHYRWQPLERDAFADWVARDDSDVDRSETARHVSAEMTGWEDLDRHGQWSAHPDLGQVWMPTTVTATWEPYRDGRWHWVSPWGWTWIDAAPWGFAPFHYGRWVQWRGRWCWVPGTRSVRPVFAPALVSWQVPAHRDAGRRPPPPHTWVPLTPHEPFRRHPHPMPPVVVVDRVSPPPRLHRDGPQRPGWQPTPPVVVQPGRPLPSVTAPSVQAPNVQAPVTVPTPVVQAPSVARPQPRVPTPPGVVRVDPPPSGPLDVGVPGAEGRRHGRGAGPGNVPGPTLPPTPTPAVPPDPTPTIKPLPKLDPKPGPSAAPPVAPAPAAERKHGAPDEGAGRKRMPEQPKDQADKAARQ